MPKRTPVDQESLNTAQRNVAALIAASGLSVNAWSVRHGLIQSSINRIVTGVQDPTAGYLQQIAAAVSSRGRKLEAWQLLAPDLGGTAHPTTHAPADADADLLSALADLPRAEREAMRRQIIERADVFRAYLREMRGAQPPPAPPPEPTTASGLPVEFVDRRVAPAPPPPTVSHHRGVRVITHPRADAFLPPRPKKPMNAKKATKKA